MKEYRIRDGTSKADTNDTLSAFKLKVKLKLNRVRVKSYPHPTATRSLTPCNHDE